MAGRFFGAFRLTLAMSLGLLLPPPGQAQQAPPARAGEPGKFPVTYAGAIRAQITSARRAYSEEIDFETAKSDRTHTFQLNLQMMWEDRFRLVAYRSQPELVRARTNTGHDIAATQPGA